MTSHDDEQADAAARLIAALEKLDVPFRVDERGRILAFDGKQEYLVTVDLSHLLTRGSGHRRLSVGKSSLTRLERGDISALFSHEIALNGATLTEPDNNEMPVSPCYSPLEWDDDTSNLDVGDAIAAQSDDWQYNIWPVTGEGDEIIGYRVSGGDYESGSDLGSSLIDGAPGELTLDAAKSTAQAHYASRYCEAEEFLNGLLDGLEDDDGPLTRHNEQGRSMCRVDPPGIDEVEVVATLRDEHDDYDVHDRQVTVCLRTLLSCNGDGAQLLEVIDFIIRRELKRFSI